MTFKKLGIFIIYKGIFMVFFYNKIGSYKNNFIYPE